MHVWAKGGLTRCAFTPTAEPGRACGAPHLRARRFGVRAWSGSSRPYALRPRAPRCGRPLPITDLGLRACGAPAPLAELLLRSAQYQRRLPPVDGGDLGTSRRRRARPGTRPDPPPPRRDDPDGPEAAQPALPPPVLQPVGRAEAAPDLPRRRHAAVRVGPRPKRRCDAPALA